MTAGKICVGAIYKKWDLGAGHFKYYVIVGDKSNELATIYINTNARYSDLPATTQANQLPVTPESLSFLDHDSFLDCGTIQECSKGAINEYLQKNKGHHLGHLTPELLEDVMKVINTSKTIEKNVSEKYGFGLK